MIRTLFLKFLFACLLTCDCFGHRTWADGPGSLEFRGDVRVPQIAFAIDEILQSVFVTGTPQPRLVIEFHIDETSLPRQAYRIERIENPVGFRITGGDPTGAMYGGLDVAEAIRINALSELAEGSIGLTSNVGASNSTFLSMSEHPAILIMGTVFRPTFRKCGAPPSGMSFSTKWPGIDTTSSRSGTCTPFHRSFAFRSSPMWH